MTLLVMPERGDCERLEVSCAPEWTGLYLCKYLYDRNWEKYQLTLQAPMDDRQEAGCNSKGSGCVELDFVSLFPRHTYKQEERTACAEIWRSFWRICIPKFLRFPEAA